MTSRADKECFVYLMLPGDTRFVTAGKFVVETLSADLHLGRFVYGASYLKRRNAVGIDPVELTLKTGTFETQKLKGVFGALRDAGPDFWGRRVIEKHSGHPELSEMDYLLLSPDDRAGALCFGLNKEPPAPLRSFNQTIHLERLLAIADAIVRDDALPVGAEHRQVAELLLLGTSMGGARPKTVVEDGEGLWLAKFNRWDDRWNQARVEHAMLELASRCGIQAARSKVVRVGDKDVLLVKRFDRKKVEDGYERARMVSGLTLLRAEESSMERRRWSYILLAEELRRVCREPAQAAKELFRRMVFNALISNTDDHPRNHAILAVDQDWSLSPAYDLTPSVPVSLEQRDLAMVCGDQGRFANARNLVSECRRFLMDPEEARLALSEMESCVRDRWYSVARASGVTERDCQQISGAFVYPGFRN